MGKTLAIIPARGGSKGISKKNIKPMIGKPLIAYTIELALKCDFIDKLVVSTDDEEIAEVSRKYGAEVPFLRPDKFAKDDSPTINALRHAVEFFDKKGEIYDYILVLEPTNPLRTIECLKETMDKIKEKDVDTVVTVFSYSIDFSDLMVLKKDGFIKPFFDVDKLTLRRQDIGENLVLLNSAAYAVKRDVLMDPKVKMLNPYGENSFLRTKVVVMPEERSVEIDTPADFKHVEYLMKNMGVKK